MKILKTKILVFVLLAILVFFFSNDFVLIDVEKTSILTAIAIDIGNDGDYIVTAQIAVPEATDTNTENKKAQISGKGKTIAGAIRDMGDVSGWFPKLSFCNLILLGPSLKGTNVIKVLDYFAKTLKVQDSALVALTEGKASDIISISTPLDNISAFALQKVMLKNPGFDRDVATLDIKTFCTSHHSPASSSYMPIVRVINANIDPDNPTQEKENSGDSSSQNSSSSSGSSTGETGSTPKENSGSGSKGGEKNNNLFDTRETALFKNGYYVGKLSADSTFVLNALNTSFDGTTIPIDSVLYEHGQLVNFLLYVLKSNANVSLNVSDTEIVYTVNLNVYCKVIDNNSENSDLAFSQNIPLPEQVKIKATDFFKNEIQTLIDTSKETGCDFLKIKEKLYRFHNKQYSRFNDDFLSKVKTSFNINVHGQT